MRREKWKKQITKKKRKEKKKEKEKMKRNRDDEKGNIKRNRSISGRGSRSTVRTEKKNRKGGES